MLDGPNGSYPGAPSLSEARPVGALEWPPLQGFSCGGIHDQQKLREFLAVHHAQAARDPRLTSTRYVPRTKFAVDSLCWSGTDSNRRFCDPLAPPTARPWCDDARSWRWVVAPWTLGPPPDNSIGMPRSATGRMTAAPVDRPQLRRTHETVAVLLALSGITSIHFSQRTGQRAPECNDRNCDNLIPSP